MTSVAKIAKSQHPDTKLSPAERTAKLLAFHPRFSSNYTQTPTPSKVIHLASKIFATS